MAGITISLAEKCLTIIEKKILEEKVKIKDSEEIFRDKKLKDYVAHQSFIGMQKSYISSTDSPLKVIIKEHNWRILINNSEIPYITSDDPIIGVDDELRGNNIPTLYVPISPKIAIIISYGINMETNNIISFEITNDSKTPNKMNQLLAERCCRENQSYNCIGSRQE